jgi:hypothetical protein
VNIFCAWSWCFYPLQENKWSLSEMLYLYHSDCAERRESVDIMLIYVCVSVAVGCAAPYVCVQSGYWLCVSEYA